MNERPTTATVADGPADIDAIGYAKSRVVDAKLGGHAELMKALPDTTDEAELNAVADRIAAGMDLPKPAVPIAEPTNAYDRMTLALSGQPADVSGRLAGQPRGVAVRAAAATADDLSQLSAYERLDRVVDAQHKAMGGTSPTPAA